MSTVRTVTVFSKNNVVDSRHDMQALPGGSIVHAFLADDGSEAVDLPCCDEKMKSDVEKHVRWGQVYVATGEWPEEAYE